MSEHQTEFDHLDAAARRLCAAHQGASPTRQPCAACVQEATDRIAERDAWQSSLEVVEMTQREVDDLLEYSTTLPTGKTIGKRWKRYLAVGAKAGSWVLCEYVEDPDPAYVGITSRLIRVTTPPAAGVDQ